MSGEREDEEEPNSSLENSNSDSEEYEWDNYRENPSFLESPSGDNSIEQEYLDPEAPAPSGGERHSSTDRALLRHRPSRPGPRASHKWGPPTFLSIYMKSATSKVAKNLSTY